MLVERDRELDMLSDLLDGVGSTGGRLVLIRGEAGIGKSALVRAFVERADQASAQTHVGYCDDLHTPPPFGPLWDIAGDEPGLKEALLARDRQRVFEVLIDLLGRRRPTVLVIEDTHWSDEATLDAIRFVGRRVSATNGLVLLTYRVGEVDVEHPLRKVIGDLPPGDVGRIELAPLSLAAIATIVGGSGRDPQRVLDATRGNPFLVTELATGPGDDVPSSVRDSVMARVARLSPPAREMLKAMAVIPDRIGADEVAALTGTTDVELAECERFGLLETGGGSVGFRHELLRRAVESALTISEQVAAHRSVLDRLASSTDPARVVHHARGANDVARLVEFGPAAARAAEAVHSHREAAAHFRAIQPYVGRLPVRERAALLTDWARVEYYLGNAESAALIDRAIGLHEESGSTIDLGVALIEGMRISREFGDPHDAVERGKSAVAMLRRGGPSSELATALSTYAMLLLEVGKGRGAELAADDAITVAAMAGDEAAAVMALDVKVCFAWLRDETMGPVLVEQAQQLAGGAGDCYAETRVLLSTAIIAMECRQLARAADFARRTRDVAMGYELPMIEAQADGVLAEVLLWTGEWALAEDLATETLTSSPGDSRLCSIIGVLRTRSGRSGGQGDLELAWAVAASRAQIEDRLRAASGLAEGIWLDGHSNRHTVDELATTLHDGIEQEYPWPAGQLAFWLWTLGVITEVPDGIAEPYVDVIGGRFRAAADAWEALGAPYERALALLSGDAADRLEALETFETLGATAVAAKVRKQLRDDGVVAPRGRGRTTRRNAAGLTARQAEVLHLLDEGLTNAEIADRLFVSPRTVENHVSALLAKLDASNRDEAVRRARRGGLLAASTRA